ncbi:MAG TPA: hypothetical protein PK282_00520, partial [Rhodoglobus sp.]|nr:hypothetical protein [Rhodoglobus sp.]
PVEPILAHLARGVVLHVALESVIAAAKLCSGEPIDERIVLDSTLIDSTNVADYVGKSPQTE